MPVVNAATLDEAAGLLSGAPSPVVVLAVYDSYEDVVCCLDSFVAHTPGSTALLVIDDRGQDERSLDLLSAAGDQIEHQVVVLRHEQNLGFVRSCNDAFAATGRRDVILLNSDVVVGPEWSERLTAAALSSASIATASTLTNHGTILSVPRRNEPVDTLPGDMSPAEAARRVAAASLRLRPAIPTAVGHCMYIRRQVIDLIGGFDEAFSPGYCEEVDFSQRAVMHGFRHVCADDVFTYHRGSGSFGRPTARARQKANGAVVQHRYPWYEPWVQASAHDADSPLADAIGAARRALSGLTVGVDAQCLGAHRMGTQQVAVDTIRALASHPRIERLVIFGPLVLPSYAQDLRSLPGVELVDIEQAAAQGQRAVDLIFRPFQVNYMRELQFLDVIADRFVVNQLDTIAFENPSYFESYDKWRDYRNLARLTFERAGGVAFLSEHSRRSAEANGLIGPATPSAVVHCGVDSTDADSGCACPVGLTEDDSGLLLVIGAAYVHKGRRRALDVWAELRRRGSTRLIVLAGPQPPYGSSRAAEAEFCLERPDLRSEVVELGAVSEEEKRWLYQHAGLVLYLSTSEGFGLVPFEAAEHGVPVLSTRQGSLDEVLPAGIPTVDGFDVQAGADLAEKLLTDESAAAGVCAAIVAAGTAFTWSQTADRLVALFEDTLRQPSRRSLAIEGEDGRHVGIVPRGQRAKARVGAASDLERLVRFVGSHPALKQTLSPDGSRRQQVGRNIVHRARHYLW